MNKMELLQLQDKIRQCTLCDLCKNNPKGTMPVPGFGPASARIMIIGECIGQQESIEEKPFVGRCGKLLRKSLKDSGIDSDQDCYITNVNRCVSRKNNKNVPPSKRNQQICRQWLVREIQLVKPKVIMTLGSVPIHTLFNWEVFDKKETLTEIINNDLGQTYEAYGSQVIPNYHPSFIMQHGRDKYDIFIKQIKLVKEIISGK